MSVFKKALILLVGNTNDLSYLRIKRTKTRQVQEKPTERELIRRESEIGRQLFGPIPKGHQREFFCLDNKTYIWHEEFKNGQGKLESITTRYEIQGDKILKVQGGAHYSYLEGAELDNILAAINLYYDRVVREVYGQDPSARRAVALA